MVGAAEADRVLAVRGQVVFRPTAPSAGNGDDAFDASRQACSHEFAAQVIAVKVMNSYASFAVLTVFTLLAALTSFAASAEDEYERAAKSGPRQRMALSIGNRAYLTEPFPNASRDALTMEERLRSLGFSVERHLNLSEKEFKFTLRQFRARVNRSGGARHTFTRGMVWDLVDATIWFRLMRT